MFVFNFRNMYLLISDIEKMISQIYQIGFLFSEFRLRMRDMVYCYIIFFILLLGAQLSSRYFFK